MKMPAYPDHGMTTATKLLGFENDNPQETFIYPVTGAFIPFIPSNARQFIGLITQSGTVVGPSLIPMTGTTNQIGTIVDSIRNSAGNFVLQFPEGTFTTGTLYAFVGPSSADVGPKILQLSVDSFDADDSKVNIFNFDVTAQENVDGINRSLHLILV